MKTRSGMAIPRQSGRAAAGDSQPPSSLSSSVALAILVGALLLAVLARSIFDHGRSQDPNSLGPNEAFDAAPRTPEQRLCHAHVHLAAALDNPAAEPPTLFGVLNLDPHAAPFAPAALAAYRGAPRHEAAHRAIERGFWDTAAPWLGRLEQLAAAADLDVDVAPRCDGGGGPCSSDAASGEETIHGGGGRTTAPTRPPGAERRRVGNHVGLLARARQALDNDEQRSVYIDVFLPVLDPGPGPLGEGGAKKKEDGAPRFYWPGKRPTGGGDNGDDAGRGRMERRQALEELCPGYREGVEKERRRKKGF